MKTKTSKMEVNENGGKEEMGSGLSPNWTDLTPECLLNIFSRLSQVQRWFGPMLVCKTWMYACQDPSLNTVFDLETRFLSIPESVKWWSPKSEEKAYSVLRSIVNWSKGRLKKIQVRFLTDESLSYVAERCPNLEVLWIKYSPNVTDASVAKIASNCPKLRELDISYSYGISHKSLTMVGKNCPNMEILYWRQPENATKEFEAIARLMPQLKHLELQYSRLDAKGLALICERCPNLEYLDLYGCNSMKNSDITAITSCLKNLKEIKIRTIPAADPLRENGWW